LNAVAKLFYVDSSVLVAILLEEQGYLEAQKILSKQLSLQSSTLLQAEIFSVCIRENIETQYAIELSESISFFSPTNLITELEKASKLGFVRGADLYHIASALYLSNNNPKELSFFTLDKRQVECAKKCGFKIVSI